MEWSPRELANDVLCVRARLTAGVPPNTLVAITKDAGCPFLIPPPERTAMYNSNRRKIGLFGANCSSGRAATPVPGRWSNSRKDSLEVTRMAEDAGLEFMLPIGCWKGYGEEEYQTQRVAYAEGMSGYLIIRDPDHVAKQRGRSHRHWFVVRQLSHRGSLFLRGGVAMTRSHGRSAGN
jgi:hypothetical protein